jgi:hypothetical protein
MEESTLWGGLPFLWPSVFLFPGPCVRNYFFKIDRSIYSGECVTDSRYSKINAPSTKEYKLFQENLNSYKNESIYE